MRNKVFDSLTQAPWFSIFLGVLSLGLIMSVVEPVFFDINNFKNILLATSSVAIIAMGVTFVIMTGGIDISVGMSLFLIMAAMWRLSLYLPIPLVFAAGILLGALGGIINGFLVAELKIVALIATLATFTIFRGAGYTLIGSQLKTVEEAVRVVGIGEIAGVPIPILLMLIICLVSIWISRYSRFGRYVLAVGNSERSAIETGLPVRLTKLSAYVYCGVCVAIAAIISIGRLGVIQTDTGYGVEFTAITAVVLGGTRLSGGTGTVIGSLLGAIFLTLINNGLNLVEASPFIYEVVTGGILFLAVVLERISNVRQEKRLVRERASRLRMG